MKILSQLLLPVCLLTLSGLISCKNVPAKKKIDYNAMSKELCACMQPLADWNNKVKETTKTQDEEAIKKLYEELGGISEKSYACAEKLENKYGEVPLEEEDKAAEALHKACPQIAEIMEQVKNLENAE